MSKQRPDPDKIANELSGASAFFRRTPQPEGTPQPEAAPTKPETPEPQPRPDVTTSTSHNVTPAAPTPASEGFDINRETASHDTLRLAVDETRAVEELKSALKWDHDLTISKNDICRVALHALLEDYRAKGASSAAVKRLKQKIGRR
ncbi:MAG: hypothetical protein M3R02_30600 [Chloroflexota bacterium]|nr:hypothetical protein [Chloroflexota bacterium]